MLKLKKESVFVKVTLFSLIYFVFAFINVAILVTLGF